MAYAVNRVVPHTPPLSIYIHLRKMLDFSVLLSKVLCSFALVVCWLDYDLHVVFYVGFRNFRKNQY